MPKIKVAFPNKITVKFCTDGLIFLPACFKMVGSGKILAPKKVEAGCMPASTFLDQKILRSLR